MSILMNSTNQRCNPLASIIGIFLHSTSTPELVIEVLAHAGLSLSLSAIHTMVTSLSNTSVKRLRTLTKTLLAAFANDNFDMDFKSWSSTIEKPGATQKHATAALVFPMSHGVTPDDLKCADILWKSDPLNPNIPPTERRPTYTWRHCLPKPSPVPGPSQRIRIIAWHFCHALVTFVPGFERFRKDLKTPETILQIPVTKTTHIPCRAMDINPSTNDGQAQVLEELLRQANLGDPTDFPNVEDIREHVVLMHGDLGTGERIFGVKQSRSIEAKPVRRLQMVVFIPGLFHLQMAAADALWRMYIAPKDLHSDKTGLYHQACRIRPHDSGRLTTKPGFRLVHEVMHQCGYARMLDVWRVALQQQQPASLLSLEDFASTNPSWEDLINLSLSLATDYVDKPSAADGLFRNNSLILARLIQYIELCHALKHGDIGRVEETFLHWVFVFKAVGKHKYATNLVKMLTDLRFVFPSSLAYGFCPYISILN